jgi:hypothetical protein
VPLLFGIAGYTLGVSYPALDDAARAAMKSSPPPPPTGGYAPSWPFVLGACAFYRDASFDSRRHARRFHVWRAIPHPYEQPSLLLALSPARSPTCRGPGRLAALPAHTSWKTNPTLARHFLWAQHPSRRL